MPFDPNGNFTIPNNLVSQYIAGQKKADPASLDANYNDIALGLAHLAAKKVNYTDFTQLLGYNPGWVKLPNGMLLQWGKTASANAASTIVTFSIAFPNVCLHCVGIGRAAGAGEQGYATVNFTTQSQAVFNCFKAMSGLAPSLAAQGAVDVWWLAIGY